MDIKERRYLLKFGLIGLIAPFLILAIGAFSSRSLSSNPVFRDAVNLAVSVLVPGLKLIYLLGKSNTYPDFLVEGMVLIVNYLFFALLGWFVWNGKKRNKIFLLFPIFIFFLLVADAILGSHYFVLSPK